MDIERLTRQIKNLYTEHYRLEDALSPENLPGTDFDIESLKVLPKAKGADIRIRSKSNSDIVYSIYIQHSRKFLVTLTRIKLEQTQGSHFQSETFLMFHDNHTIYQSDIVRYSKGRLDTLTDTILKSLPIHATI